MQERAPSIRTNPRGVPTSRRRLPHGQEVLLVGDPQRFAALPFGSDASSAACCARVCDLLGRGDRDTRPAAGPLSEQFMLDQLDGCGATPAVAEEAQSLEELGQVIDSGAAVIALVDAGSLWDWQPAASGDGANHAVLIVATAHDDDGRVIGALVDDPAHPVGAQFVTEEVLLRAWLEPGGRMVCVGGAA